MRVQFYDWLGVVVDEVRVVYDTSFKNWVKVGDFPDAPQSWSAVAAEVRRYPVAWVGWREVSLGRPWQDLEAGGGHDDIGAESWAWDFVAVEAVAEHLGMC